MSTFALVKDKIRILHDGQVGKNRYPVTITMNVKHKDYAPIYDLNEFRQLFYAFLHHKGYKYRVDAIMEFHDKGKPLRPLGGLHAHGYADSWNPPKDNKNNLFHFYLEKNTGGLEGQAQYYKYCLKNRNITPDAAVTELSHSGCMFDEE